MYNYRLIKKPSENLISISEIKEFLGIVDLASTQEDVYIKELLNTAIQYVEDYTGRDLFFKKYYTYRTNFYEINNRYIKYFYEIEKCLVESIDNIKYLTLDGNFTDLDIAYYSLVQNLNDWSQIELINVEEKKDIKNIYNNIKITFNSGFGYEIDTIIKSGTIITIKTKNINNLNVSDRVVISDVDNNIFNGVFYIKNIIDDFSFELDYVPIDENDIDDVVGAGSFMTVNNVPSIYLETIKRVIMFLYDNRGDCGEIDVLCLISNMLYGKKILKIGI
jgi:hypothetical protein